jgi:lipoprotein-anchoring transpeptidase ErfK/SrfK
LVSAADDTPNEKRGLLIPRVRAKDRPVRHQFTPQSAHASSRARAYRRFGIIALGVVALALVGSTGFGLVAQSNMAAAPTVTIIDPYTETGTPLEYGPQQALAQSSVFVQTRDAFIDDGHTFIEVDITNRMLRYFEHGVLVQSAEILGVGEDGSWWDTPSGLYQIESKSEEVFTNIGQAYLPWQIKFQGNFVIHGWPTYPDETAVSSDFSGGGIRLSDGSAQALYRNVAPGTPILVHAKVDTQPDTFVYQPQVPELDSPHYFIADIDNGTILAASDLDVTVPIASVTKLMTAVVAAEEIDLDGRVQVTSPTFVTSLIPRLAERTSVSMYSLLQLLLVESSNEAAETIAGEFGREAFIEAMNAKARQLGMLETTFADPSGLSAENTSSLGDLYRLTQYIYRDRPFIFEITKNEAVPNVNVADEFSGLVNFNEVEDMESFAGGKVGETRAAGQTSVSLHSVEFQEETRTLAVILLGSEDRTQDIQTLLAYVENRFGR